jgi:ATP-binding cassette, subfamily B, bacterial
VSELRRLLALAGSTRPAFIATAVASVASAVLSLGFPVLSGAVVDALARARYPEARIAAVALGLVTIVMAGSWYAARRFEASFLTAFGLEVRRLIGRKLAVVDIGYLLSHSEGEIHNQVNGDVESLVNTLQNAFFPSVSSYANLAIAFVTMLALNWRLALIAAALTAPWFFFQRALSTRNTGLAEDANAARDRLTEVVLSNYSVGGVLRARAFPDAVRDAADFRSAAAEIRRASVAVRDVYSLQTLGMLVAGAVGSLVVVLVGVSLVESHAVSLGVLVAFITYQNMVHGSVAALASSQFHAGTLRAALDRIGAVLGAPERPSGALRRRGETIALSAAQYTYANGTRALTDCTLRVRRGEKIAILGKSGSGKSTLAMLLAGFLLPERGELLIDDVPAPAVDAGSLRRLFTYDSDRLHVFRGSIADNVAYGVPGAEDARVREAARLACADDFVAALPDGYGTSLNANADNLSMGQLRRLGIARAIAPGAPFLILDEPSSALDAETHTALFRNLLALPSAVIAITHRLALTARFDTVVVLDGGRIVEQGAPAALLAAGGHYAAMMQASADSDRDAHRLQRTHST